jgi:maltooligosyltrehalose trehalohydrolase
MRKDIDVNRRGIGINFNNRKEAEINIWAPLAEQVEVKLESVSIPLEKDEYGYWYAVTQQLLPGALYKIAIDGNAYPEPASLAQPKGVHEHSAAIDLQSFTWTDDQWDNIPLEEYIIYELHTGTFSSEETFKGVENKLDYLKELGVTAIEIMPVAQFPGSRNWGYDGVFPFAVQSSYGGAEGLQQLVNACHTKGIAVILDVVYNHLGPEGNYFGSFGPYFTNKYNTPWGNAINFDDAYCDGVRRYFIENALMWLRDFHIDALRLDAVHAIKDFSPMHILREIKEHVDELQKQSGKQHYLVVELDLNDNRFINPIDAEGYGMDAQWVDEFHHALRVTAGGEITGYYADFNGIEHLAKSYRDAYVYDGQYSHHRKKMFGIKADTNKGQQFVVFSQNHDQVGNRMLGERTSQLVSFEMQKLMAAAVLVSPYLPLLFMGEEYAEPNPFLYFVSHTDAELAEAVRQGRKQEFAAFHAAGEAPDPVSEETFQRSKLQWNSLQQQKHQTMFLYYKELIRIRKETPVLKTLNRENVTVEVHREENVLTLTRRHKEQTVLCMMNFSQQTQCVKVPGTANEWKKLLASHDTQWNGSEGAPMSIQPGKDIMLQPESALIYSSL